MRVTVSRLRGRVEVSDDSGDTVTVTVDDYGEIWVWHGLTTPLVKWQAHCACPGTHTHQERLMEGRLNMVGNDSGDFATVLRAKRIQAEARAEWDRSVEAARAAYETKLEKIAREYDRAMDAARDMLRREQGKTTLVKWQASDEDITILGNLGELNQG